MCSHTGRPSIAPERLIRGLLLQTLYSIRSQRQWVEQLQYGLRYRWFVGLGMEDRVRDASSFSTNRDLRPAQGAGGMKKVKLRGTAQMHGLFTPARAAYTLARLRTLLLPQAQSV